MVFLLVRKKISKLKINPKDEILPQTQVPCSYAENYGENSVKHMLMDSWLSVNIIKIKGMGN